MKKLFRIIILVLLCVLALYLIWSNTGRVTSMKDIQPRYVIGSLTSYGTNTGKGNLLALSPYLHPYDFSSREAFHGMLDYYFNLARQRGFLNDSTVVILPEYLGTWLIAAGEKEEIYRDTTMEFAMERMAMSSLFGYARQYIRSSSDDPAKEALFRLKADRMLEIYQSTFSQLAQDYKVSIVAGSIVLPTPDLKSKKITLSSKGPLYNVSAVFLPDGNVAAPLTYKQFPIQAEKGFTAIPRGHRVPAYALPAGRLSVLICADSWYPAAYDWLKHEQADLLAIPCFLSGEQTMQQRWRGYNGHAAPDDVIPQDSSLTELAAWLKYSAGRADSLALRASAHVFLRGDLWDMGSDGQTIIRFRGQTLLTPEPEEKTGSLINIWLE